MILTFNELTNTFKFVFGVFKSSVLAIKTNNPNIKTYKTLLKKISRYIPTILPASFKMTYHGLLSDATKHSTPEDKTTNTIISFIISVPIATVITIIYSLSIIILWTTYAIWKRKLSRIKKENKDETIIDI